DVDGGAAVSGHVVGLARRRRAVVVEVGDGGRHGRRPRVGQEQVLPEPVEGGALGEVEVRRRGRAARAGDGDHLLRGAGQAGEVLHYEDGGEGSPVLVGVLNGRRQLRARRDGAGDVRG